VIEAVAADRAALALPSAFSEAVAAATGGAVRLANSAQPESVTAAELETGEAVRTVIGIVYKHSGFRSSAGK
jgi:hypothetical protein